VRRGACCCPFCYVVRSFNGSLPWLLHLLTWREGAPVACAFCCERGAASRKLRASAYMTENGSSVIARLFAGSMLTVAYLCMCVVAARFFFMWGQALHALSSILWCSEQSELEKRESSGPAVCMQAKREKIVGVRSYMCVGAMVQ
jgi:hypothetical protein